MKLTHSNELQLENTLFRFHKHFFLRDSAAFRDMFTLSAPPGEEAEGSSDDNPIILDESKKDFECFLSFYYSKWAPNWVTNL